MSLSSRNRSIFNTFRLILPCVAPVCEGMHYHKTGVPWQMKSTRIIKIFYHKKPKNAIFWGILPTCFFYYKSYILSAVFAKYGKTMQFTPLIRSKIVVKIFGITTLDFAPLWSFSKPRGGIVKRYIFPISRTLKFHQEI